MSVKKWAINLLNFSFFGIFIATIAILACVFGNLFQYLWSITVFKRSKSMSRSEKEINLMSKIIICSVLAPGFSTFAFSFSCFQTWKHNIRQSSYSDHHLIMCFHMLAKRKSIRKQFRTICDGAKLKQIRF